MALAFSVARRASLFFTISLAIISLFSVKSFGQKESGSKGGGVFFPNTRDRLGKQSEKKASVFEATFPEADEGTNSRPHGSVRMKYLNSRGGGFAAASQDASSTNTAFIRTIILLNGDENCFPDGKAQLHIHSFWNTTADSGYGAEECGPAVTGAHYDPTLACGPATEASELCKSSDLLGGTELEPYKCSTDMYKKNRFYFDEASGLQRSLCQVGDLNNKFGKANDTQIPPKTNNLYQAIPASASGLILTTDVDPMTIDQRSLITEKRSIVIHCVDGTRVACAPLVPGGIQGALIDAIKPNSMPESDSESESDSELSESDDVEVDVEESDGNK